MGCSPLQFLAIILNVLENIDVNNCVKLLRCIEGGQSSANGFAGPSSGAQSKSVFELHEQLRIRLEAYPSPSPARIQIRCIGSDSSAYFENLLTYETPEVA